MNAAAESEFDKFKNATEKYVNAVDKFKNVIDRWTTMKDDYTHVSERYRVIKAAHTISLLVDNWLTRREVQILREFRSSRA